MGLDVRRHGSGNVGATNAYEVSGKKSVGGTVFALDFLKGLIPVLCFAWLGWYDPMLVLLPALILGHCYPVWLGFHGGRGLATTAGAILVVNPAMLAIWCGVFLLTKKVKNQVHFAATVATLFSIGLLVLLPSELLQATTLQFSGLAQQPSDLTRSAIVTLVLILSRHIEPLLSLMKQRKNS